MKVHQLNQIIEDHVILSDQRFKHLYELFLNWSNFSHSIHQAACELYDALLCIFIAHNCLQNWNEQLLE